ncbi:MAG: 30S ribosomal protein S16 [Candidatus Neomarinimicrobiota bacterium]
MATRIRLKRIGRKNKPFYRVVVMDSRKRRDGAAIEELGWYNPIAKDKTNNFELKEERILHWLQLGALPSDIAHKLMKRAGIAMKWHLMKQGLDDKAIEKELQKLDLRREAQAKEKLETSEKESKKKGKESKKSEEVKEAVGEESEKEQVETEKTEPEQEEAKHKMEDAKAEETPKTEVTEEKSVKNGKEAEETKDVKTIKKSTPKKKSVKKSSAKKAESLDKA